MDTFGYGRCCQCDEENFLRDGSTCACCLGLGYTSIDDKETEEESSNVSLDLPAAA